MMTVRLIAHTPEPEKVVAAAAKLCYSDAHITDLLDGLDEEKTARFLTMLSDLGHASPIEHASFTFGIEGVSRTLLAQITRHRIASFSVQSQRYVRLDAEGRCSLSAGHSSFILFVSSVSLLLSVSSTSSSLCGSM